MEIRELMLNLAQKSIEAVEAGSEEIIVSNDMVRELYEKVLEIRLNLESVQRERDEHRQSALEWERNADSHAREVESLQRDKAALIEVLEWYGKKNHLGKFWAEDGQKARDILSKMKGETP